MKRSPPSPCRKGRIRSSSSSLMAMSFSRSAGDSDSSSNNDELAAPKLADCSSAAGASRIGTATFLSRLAHSASPSWVTVIQ